MLRYVDEFIIRFASLISTLVLLAIFLAFNFAIFPQLSPKDETIKPLDLQYLYSGQEAYAILDQLSQPERRLYFLAECSVDLIYPVIYTTMFCFVLFLLFRNLTIAKLPLLIITFDYLENTGILILLRAYPRELYTVASITGIFSGLKWMFALLVVIITISGLLNALRKVAL